MLLKQLIEKRNVTLQSMETLMKTVGDEQRSLNADEATKFSTMKSEVESIDTTIKAEEARREMTGKKNSNQEEEKRSATDVFSDFVKGETRDAGEMSKTENGNIVPTELSKDIIKKVTERSGLFNKIGKINSIGKYQQIVESTKMTAGWVDELAEVTKSDSKFNIVEIGHYKLGALTKISTELVNQANFNVTSEVISQISDAFADKVEDAIIRGDGSKKPTGLVSSGVTVNLASKTAVTADELIDIFHAIKAPYIPGATWLMNRQTLAAIRKLKDSDGQYLFQADMTKEFVGMILGKGVILSEFVDGFGVSKNPILFGELGSAYKANVNPQQTIQILRELYSTQGAIGVLGFLFIDGKPVNAEAYAVAKCPAV